MNVPNLCTMTRVVLAPVFVVLFLQQTLWGTIAALAVAVLFELTDLADGILARRRKETTSLGKLLDPFADSVSRFSVFLAFYAHPERYAYLWMVFIFFYRDATVNFCRILAAKNNFVMSARLSGKIKAWAQGIAIITPLAFLVAQETGIFAALDLEVDIPLVSRILVGVAAAVTLYSLVDYLRGAHPHLVAAAHPEPPPERVGESDE